MTKETDPEFTPLPWLNRIPGYQYYDTPDGEDCLKKVIYMNKLGVLFGGFYSTLDVISFSKPVGVGNIALRYATITLPLMAIGSTFAAVTCLSTNIRKKDDFWNYFWGGVAAGGVTGAVTKSGPLGTLCALTFGCAGMTKKYAIQEGWTLLPPHTKKHENETSCIWTVNFDLSLTPDNLPKGWKKAGE